MSTEGRAVGELCKPTSNKNLTSTIKLTRTTMVENLGTHARTAIPEVATDKARGRMSATSVNPELRLVEGQPNMNT